MEIQVILREIGVERDVKADPCHALQHKRVGRDLHHDVRAAAVRHAPEQLLKLKALRRCKLRMDVLVADHVAVCSDQPDLGAQLFLQHVPDEIARCRLAAGPGDPDDRHLPGGIAVKVAARKRQSQTAVRDLDIGCSVRGNILAQHGGRPLFQGRWDKAVTVGRKALDGDKKVARLHLSRIVAHACDFLAHIRRGGKDLKILQQFR